MDQLVIENPKGTESEILIDFNPSSFKYEYEVNNERSLTFTAFKTNMNADVFNMLQNESIVKWKSQKYVIKETSIKSDNAFITMEVTAKHIFMEFQNHYVDKNLESESLNDDTVAESETDDTSESNTSLTLKQYLDFAFEDNELGFSYRIIGSFDKRKKVDELGNKNGLEYLIEGAELFDYIYFADNKIINIFEPEKFYEMSDEVIRYKYNTDEVSASISTTEIKTYIKGYGKKKTTKETKNYNPVKTPQMDLNGSFIKKGTWRTENKGDSYSHTFNCKWGNETLVYNLKKGNEGGLLKVYLDDEYIDTFSCFAHAATTERIILMRNLKKGPHTFKVVFAGGDPSLNYKKHTPVGYVGTEKQTVLNLTSVLKGDDLYHFKAEEKSDNYDVFGHKAAPTIFDDEVETEDELKNKLKQELKSDPTVELSTNYLGHEEIKENHIVRFIHEPLGFNTDLKVVKITESHPLTNQPVDVEFSNASKDIITIQQTLNKKIKNSFKPSKYKHTSTNVGVGIDYDIVGSVAINE
ncbi:prophage endopeptidase tail family protein [Staphylococcus pettenkoferi]|uniref:prophage endopeptidase tail family protein n=1 Tax=Staphylococcus pettenkoferi TaxID=170573 RepID=UPI0022746D47|nr:prophage endopeptidase tail family protein [Staphylococcus pettenkoferi]MCY1589846.1 phage tail protein [Staphylococcus pettenkoferi]MCY1599236.1 phage tail protein [Staphylococcus pettenkoferi]MCY1613790.1 phage tail protein [Staphylococcus pettenkoferi]